METPVNIKSKFNLFSDLWSPKVIAEMNNYQFKLVKIKGDFIWHQHDTTDEVFIVLEGEMGIEFRNKTIKLVKDEMFVVKKGLEHKPFSKIGSKVLIIEPRGIINTGSSNNKLTAENDVWI